MSNQTPTMPASYRVGLSFFIPIAAALVISTLVSILTGSEPVGIAGRSVLLGSVGLTSWLLGQRWYGLRALGLRGGRPLFAGAGFAFLGWIALLVVRIWYIETVEDQIGSNLLRDFSYLLFFEAFATQIWTFGTFFRSVAAWRGALTAAVTAGILFGATAFTFFLESSYDVTAGLGAFLYFSVWGVFYGIVRLRTGSILGIVLVQALQTLTAWHIFLPRVPATIPETFNWLYTWMSLVYVILIWRLWPQVESDYRV